MDTDFLVWIYSIIIRIKFVDVDVLVTVIQQKQNIIAIFFVRVIPLKLKD